MKLPAIKSRPCTNMACLNLSPPIPEQMVTVDAVGAVKLTRVRVPLEKKNTDPGWIKVLASYSS
jgi:hypothetical protein